MKKKENYYYMFPLMRNSTSKMLPTLTHYMANKDILTKSVCVPDLHLILMAFGEDLWMKEPKQLSLNPHTRNSVAGWYQTKNRKKLLRYLKNIWKRLLQNKFL